MPPLAVADTSALLSLGVGAQKAQNNPFPNPLDCLVQARDVVIPPAVEKETTDAAYYTPPDITAHGANDVLHHISKGDITVESITASLQGSPSLDKGERHAIKLANDEGADEFVCDETNPTNTAVISQALTDPDSLLSSMELVIKFIVVDGLITKSEGEDMLRTIAPHRSWSNNAHFQKVMSRF